MPLRAVAKRSGKKAEAGPAKNGAGPRTIAENAPNGSRPNAGHLNLPQDLGRRWRRVRYNPITNFTPQRLTAALEQFELGYIRDAALLWDALEKRDDILKGAGPKRRKSVSRQAWEIVQSEDSPEASRQKEALEYFYNNLSVTNAVDENLRATFPALVRGMMDAQFHYYSVHEIVWRPGPRGLTAEFRKVPLWFFENRTGRLRYTGPEFSCEGQDLDEDGWMITCGDGIMEAASVCCMFKRLSLQDWLNFGEKFGLPGIHGECSAARGSSEWQDFVGALESFANDWIVATSSGAKINLIETGKTGDAPFAPMVDRMDRRLAAMCRGADLSTISKDREASGASLQGDETNLLVEDDCALVTETLNEQVDRRVIRLVFGPASEVLANIRINPPKKRDIRQDMLVDKFLISSGAPVSVTDALERYGRPMPDDGEPLLRAPRAAAAGARDGQPPEEAGAPVRGRDPGDGAAGNESGPDEPGLGKFLAEARELLATAMHDDLAPLRDALRRAVDGDLSDAELANLRDAMPGIMAAIADGRATAEALAMVNGASLADGLARGPDLSVENEFREEDHPRHPKGSEEGGGRFMPKADAEETIGDVDMAGPEAKQRRLKERARAKGRLSAEDQRSIIRQVVARAADPSDQTGADFGAVSDVAIEKAEAAGEDLAGYTKRIEPDFIRHERARHFDPGVESSRGQVALTDRDFEALPDVLDDPDHVEESGLDAGGQPMLRFEKRSAGGFVLIAQVRRGNKRISPKSFRKRKS